LTWLRGPTTSRRPNSPVQTSENVLGGVIGRSRASALDRRISDLTIYVVDTLARVSRQAEQRYDLAIGLVCALATIFIFYG
jgi:hypothetical protein